MNHDSHAVFDAALALPESDRALLAERLLETLSPDSEDMSDEELLAELDRRRAEMSQGDPGVLWSDLKNDG